MNDGDGKLRQESRELIPKRSEAACLDLEDLLGIVVIDIRDERLDRDLLPVGVRLKIEFQDRMERPFSLHADPVHELPSLFRQRDRLFQSELPLLRGQFPKWQHPDTSFQLLQLPARAG